MKTKESVEAWTQMGGEDEGQGAVLGIVHASCGVTAAAWLLRGSVGLRFTHGVLVAHALSISPPRQEHEILLMRTKHVNQSTSNGNLNKAYI